MESMGMGKNPLDGFNKVMLLVHRGFDPLDYNNSIVDVPVLLFHDDGYYSSPDKQTVLNKVMWVELCRDWYLREDVPFTRTLKQLTFLRHVLPVTV